MHCSRIAAVAMARVVVTHQDDCEVWARPFDIPKIPSERSNILVVSMPKVQFIDYRRSSAVKSRCWWRKPLLMKSCRKDVDAMDQKDDETECPRTRTSFRSSRQWVFEQLSLEHLHVDFGAHWRFAMRQIDRGSGGNLVSNNVYAKSGINVCYRRSLCPLDETLMRSKSRAPCSNNSSGGICPKTHRVFLSLRWDNDETNVISRAHLLENRTIVIRIIELLSLKSRVL